MVGENLLCLEGPCRLTAVIINGLGALLSIGFVVIWWFHRHDDLDRNVGCQIAGRDRYEPDYLAVPIFFFYIISLVGFILMACGWIKNYPSFFKSVSASIWTLLCHCFILFLTPFIAGIMYLASWAQVDAVFNQQSAFGAVASCDVIPLETSRAIMIVGMAISGFQFVANIIIFKYTIDEVSLLL